MTIRHWIPALALGLFLFLPESLAACPVCFDPNDENRMAFITTAIFLTLMPFGLLGAAGLWLRKRIRDLQGGESQDGESTRR